MRGYVTVMGPKDGPTAPSDGVKVAYALHMVKAMVPERVCQIIDQAIQMHGATGVL